MLFLCGSVVDLLRLECVRSCLRPDERVSSEMSSSCPGDGTVGSSSSSLRSCLAIISPELGKYQPKHRDSDDVFGGPCQDFDIFCEPAEIA